MLKMQMEMIVFLPQELVWINLVVKLQIHQITLVMISVKLIQKNVHYHPSRAQSNKLIVVIIKLQQLVQKI